MLQYPSGKFHESGKEILADIDVDIAQTVRDAVDRNMHNWDYKAPVVGTSGVGKSTFERQFGMYAKYYLKTKYNIDVDVHIAMDGAEFEEIAQRVPKYSIIILDEAFADMNSNVSRSKDFQRIVNMLQIIRQKSYIILMSLPNFFDLSKSIALFQTNHLFVVDTSKEGIRGVIRVYDKDKKQALYLKGKKEMNYYCVKPNYLARFYKNAKAMDNESYEKKKTEHFMNLNKKLEKITPKSERNNILFKLKQDYHFKIGDLEKVSGLKQANIYKILETYRD